jgi:hypothetical protein
MFLIEGNIPLLKLRWDPGRRKFVALVDSSPMVLVCLAAKEIGGVNKQQLKYLRDRPSATMKTTTFILDNGRRIE